MTQSRDEKIKESSQLLKKTVQKELDLKPLLGGSNPLKDEDELILLLNIYNDPSLIKYIINYRNLTPNSVYPKNSGEALRKYLEERTQHKFIPYIEVLTFLNKLGLKMNEYTYYLGYFLAAQINPMEKDFQKYDSEKLQNAILPLLKQYRHTQLWLRIIGEKKLSYDQVIVKIMIYLNKNIDLFVEEEALSLKRN